MPLAKQRGKDVKYLALKHGILLTENKAVVEEGWEGKAKGILQILHKHGLIDESNYKTRTLDGRKDPESGGILPGTSLHGLLEKCSDFRNE